MSRRLDALTPSLPDELWEAAREPVTATPEWAARCQGWSEGALPAEVAEAGPLVFERKGKYKSHGPIAFGGMGEVYRAWEFGLERWVAIKVPSRARRSPKAIARFLEEAPRQAQLEHANIVRVYARDEQDGVPYFAMELVTGETLAKAAREPGLNPTRVARLMRQIAQAVHAAHKVGVFHRDLKPTNIMLTAEGIPKVVDFGLARTLDGPTPHSPAAGAGTDEYMVPEQWEDDPESPLARTDAYARTDVYGFGAILYELLTKQAPFLRAAHRNETRRRVRFDEPKPPRALCKAIPRSGSDLPALPPKASRGPIRDCRGCRERAWSIHRWVSSARMLMAHKRDIPRSPASNDHCDFVCGTARGHSTYEFIRLHLVDKPAIRSAS